MRTSRAPLSLALVVAWALPTTRSVTVRNDPNDDKWVVKRQDAPFFVSLFKRGDCAGTIIGQRHVITAAHCVCGAKKGIKTLLSDNAVAKPVRAFGNPACVFSCKKDKPNRCDTAVLEYEEDLVDASVPLPVYQDSDELGQTMIIYGMGITGTPSALNTPKKCRKAKDSQGKLIRARNVVTEVAKGIIRYRMDEGGLSLEGMAQDGDSGGPLILEKAGRRFVAGANSGTSAKNPCAYGSVDEYARLSTHYAFIAKVLDPNDSSISPILDWSSGSNSCSKIKKKRACRKQKKKCRWNGQKKKCIGKLWRRLVYV